MKTLLAVLLLVLAGSSARASISGNWTGSVDYTVSEGDYQGSDSWACEFALIRQGKYLYVSDPDWCTYLDTRYDIIGDELWVEGTQIGTITENSVHFEYEGSSKWKMDLTVNDDGTLTMKETMSKPKRCGHTFSDMTVATFDADAKKSALKKKSTSNRHKLERVR